ncbi:iron-containing alcohol dehydrogenase [Facklamia sp. P12955]|uniref:iron-containing alcohol dehydrogenase n=1 Tax=Facklamia sp. P12955 TaxID=3421946 RepID=UPI003D166592
MKIPEYYEFMNSVKILSGKGALENIPFELLNLEAQRPLILTDESLIKHGQVQIITEALEDANIEIAAIFKEVPQDSSLNVVHEISDVYQTHQCDSIIAIGGGSVIDTAKGVNVLVSKKVKDLNELMGLELVGGKLNPLIVVPSTAGTGSEATLVSVIADTSRKVKLEFISYSLLPDVAVLDYRMTASLPAKITASTGIDALTHSIEALTGCQKNPLSSAYALAAIELIGKHLKEAVQNGKNKEARIAMANASLMAGISFSNSMVGIVHAIGHACGSISKIAHGDAMAILLPYAMEMNLKHSQSCKEEYARILLAFSGPEVYSQTPKDQRAARIINAIKDLLNELHKIAGLPTRLRDVDVKKEDFKQIAKTAMNDGATIVNPVQVTTERIMDILEAAY